MFDRQAESIVGKTLKATGHILDLYCVRLSNTVPFFENYAQIYFNAKHLEKGLNRGGDAALNF